MKFMFALLLSLFAAEAYAVDCNDLHKALKNGIADLKHCFKLPYMDEGYIPQGIHITNTNLAYVSMYHKDVDGNSSKKSIVAEIDKNNGSYKKYTLPTTGHVGGVALFDNYSKFVVPKGKAFCIYTKRSKSTGDCQTQSIGSSTKITGFSFINYAPDHNGDRIMWAGQFETSSAAGDGMHIFGYQVTGSSISKTPGYRFYVPPAVHKVQGAAVIAPDNAKGDYKILVSSSYGDHPSTMTLLTYARHEPYNYKYKYIGHKTVYVAPAGMEEVHATTTTQGVWTLFESGAQYYDRKWSSTGMPFMVRIPFDELGL